MSYKYLNMSKLSDTGLILLIIGTFLIVLSLILSIFIASPNLFLIIQINGWILFCIALIFIIKTKETGLLLVDINSYKYTGKFTYFTIVYPICCMSFFAILTKCFNILKNKKPN
jgi:hypothetical protein